MDLTRLKYYIGSIAKLQWQRSGVHTIVMFIKSRVLKNDRNIF